MKWLKYQPDEWDGLILLGVALVGAGIYRLFGLDGFLFFTGVICLLAGGAGVLQERQ